VRGRRAACEASCFVKTGDDDLREREQERVRVRVRAR
jgi:hypothetical protein